MCRSLAILVLFSSVAFAQTNNAEQGREVPNARPQPPMITTPIIDLNQTSPSPAGASNATPGNVAGATDSTLNNVPSTSGSVRTQPEVTNDAFGAVPQSPGQEGDGPAGGPARPQVDLGVGSMGGPGGLSPLPDDRSLGEVAAEYRRQREARRAARQAREAARDQALETSPADRDAPGTSSDAVQHRSSVPAQPQIAQAQPPTAPSQPDAEQQPRDETAELAEDQGGPLPPTATWLPLLALAGLLATIAGLALRGR